jgi:hypothetical protein
MCGYVNYIWKKKKKKDKAVPVTGVEANSFVQFISVDFFACYLDGV